MVVRDELREIVSGKDELLKICEEAFEIIDGCADLDQMEAARIRLLGKKGTVTGIFKQLGSLSPEDKPLYGKAGNLLRELVTAELQSKSEALAVEKKEASLREGSVDVTLPGRRRSLGHKHLITSTIEEITNIFLSLGYRVESGPEVELDYYNFEALNTPTYHPARSLQDTLYVKRLDPNRDDRDDILLRTHTSPVQVRTMEKHKPPLYVISPGKAYRKDELDATHSPMFFQSEGFAVDEGINMGHLKGTLEVFAKKLFGEDRRVRFRPHFFPFTEPSAELDISCFICDGSGCPLCKGAGWLEILGCGMIDPNVLEYVGYDTERYTGFAFGMGIERVAMMKYGIDDLRVFTENDVRFLKQF